MLLNKILIGSNTDDISVILSIQGCRRIKVKDSLLRCKISITSNKLAKEFKNILACPCKLGKFSIYPSVSSKSGVFWPVMLYCLHFSLLRLWITTVALFCPPTTKRPTHTYPPTLHLPLTPGVLLLDTLHRHVMALHSVAVCQEVGTPSITLSQSMDILARALDNRQLHYLTTLSFPANNRISSPFQYLMQWL